MSQWDGPIQPRKVESANEHYSPPPADQYAKRRRTPEDVEQIMRGTLPPPREDPTMVSFTNDAAHNAPGETRLRCSCEGCLNTVIVQGTPARGSSMTVLCREHGQQIQTHTPAEILNASRVRWKFNGDARWRYGRPIGYTDKPVYIIEREEDGVRVAVLAMFHPEPVEDPEPLPDTVTITREAYDTILNGGADEIGLLKRTLRRGTL